MRIAILSDIHGNSHALRSILNSEEFRITDLRVNAGDCIGYFPDSNFVIDTLQKHNFISIRGNHEDIFFESLLNKTLEQEYEARCGLSLRKSRKFISLDNIAYLESLPSFVEIPTSVGNIFLFHGTPEGNHNYFYPDSPIDSITRCMPSDCRWLILGNTHWPMIRHVGEVTVINPGSVGQPRNGSPGAHWAVLDTDSLSITFFNTQYSYCKIIHQMDYLANDFFSNWENLAKR